MGEPVNAWGELEPDDRPTPDRDTPGTDTRGIGIADLLDGAFRAIRPVLPTLLAATAIVVTALTLVNVLAMLVAARWVAANLPTEAILLAPAAAEQAAALAVLAEGASRVLALAGTLLVSGLLAPILSSRSIPNPDSSAGPRERSDLARLWAALRPRFGSLVGAAAAVAGILVAGVLVGALPGLVLVWGSSSWDDGTLVLVVGALVAAAGGFVGFVAALLIWGVRLCLAPQAVVLEGRGVGSALARSAELVRGRYWRVLGALAVATVITWVVQGLVSAPFATLSALVSSSQGTDAPAVLGLTAAQLSITGLGVVVSTSLAFPVLAAVLTVLFDDLRRLPLARLRS